MAGRVLTNVYLEDAQKKALAKKAEADRTNISAEMHRTLDLGAARAEKFFAGLEAIKKAAV